MEDTNIFTAIHSNNSFEFEFFLQIKDFSHRPEDQYFIIFRQLTLEPRPKLLEILLFDFLTRDIKKQILYQALTRAFDIQTFFRFEYLKVLLKVVPDLVSPVMESFRDSITEKKYQECLKYIESLK